jgi:hypothetical protein
MLPDAQDRPAQGAQAAVDPAVARSVGPDLARPEGAPARGQPMMEGAAVPEAAVDEHRQPDRGEGEVGAAGQPQAAAPTGDAGGAQGRDEPELGGGVALAADEGHQGAALGGRQEIGHGRMLPSGRRGASAPALARGRPGR